MMEKKDLDIMSVSSAISDESELRTKGFFLRKISHVNKSVSLDFEPGPHDIIEKKELDKASMYSRISDGAEMRMKEFALQKILLLRRSVSLEFEPRPFEMSANTLSDTDTVVQTSSSLEARQSLDASSSFDLKECEICYTQQPSSEFPEIISCHHRYCLDCLQTYLQLQIREGRIDITCPKCTAKMHPSDVRDILKNEELMEKYEEFMIRRVLATEPDARWCPAPDCSYAVIASGCSTCPKLTCGRPECKTEFCYLCKEHWHPDQTCAEARAERMDSSNIIQSDFIKPCPECGSLIEKKQDGSCNQMNCPICGAEFCWLCLKKINDFHFLSPSGCTYYGSKTWSKEKKRKAQLAGLVGAPVLIPVAAGLTLPYILGRIPYSVGREINSKYKTKSSIKRKLAVAAGVIASVPVAPIVAGLAFGLGVPALLGYTYGVFLPKFIRKGCLSTKED